MTGFHDQNLKLKLILASSVFTRHLNFGLSQWFYLTSKQYLIHTTFFQRSTDKFGAFCEWNVILCCDKNKESSYKRLLEAGGATVTSQRCVVRNEPPHGKTNNLHRRKQRRRSDSQ